MYQKELELIGLSPNEAKIYETLLRIGESGVSEIANKSNVHRRSVYDTVLRLIEKGLVFQIFQKNENLYQAVDPRKCLEFLKEKEKKFLKVLPGLEFFHKKENISEAAFIYRGIEGYKNYVRDLIRVGEDCYFLGAKNNWATPETSHLTEEFQKIMKKKNKKIFTLFDPRVKKIFQKKEYQKIGGEFKFLPPEYETSGVLDVFGDYVATFNSIDIGNFGGEGSIFIMVNKELADSYRTWFQFIWNSCEEV